MGGGDAFYKQFDKIVNLNNTLNCRNQNFIKSKINNFLAFSLIELSIVLIIIGLLVAGVTGGASLIESARRRALINEITGYKQAFLAFYAKNGRYPGDVNNIGFVGYNSGQTYNANSFPFPYDGTDTGNNHYSPNLIFAPFVDMYLDKTLEFEPKGTVASNNPSSYEKGTEILPSSNIMKDMFYFYELGSDDGNKDSSYAKVNLNYKQLLSLKYYNNVEQKLNLPTIMKDIDTKIDDGEYNNGVFRTSCSGNKSFGFNSYDDAVNAKKSCRTVYLQIL